LSVAYGIVQEHGGFITVESEPGRGSRFAIHLPRGES
jgi:signal transduction histidine kinase